MMGRTINPHRGGASLGEIAVAYKKVFFWRGENPQKPAPGRIDKRRSSGNKDYKKPGFFGRTGEADCITGLEGSKTARQASGNKGGKIAKGALRKAGEKKQCMEEKDL